MYSVRLSCSRGLERGLVLPRARTVTCAHSRYRLHGGGASLLLEPPPSTHCTARWFSDRLLGHSPMAPGTANSKISSSNIPTAADVTTAGGVWAPTSAKREKLREFKAELAAEEAVDRGEQVTLDDLATDLQKLDLYLADGLCILTQITDSQSAVDSGVDGVPMELKQAQDFWMSHPLTRSADKQLTQAQWEEYLTDISKELEQVLSTLPSDRCLRDLRDGYFPPASSETETEDTADSITTSLRSNAADAVARYRLLLALGVAEHMNDSWKILTAISDQDVDRAAVKGETLESEAKHLALDKLQAVLEAYLMGTCSDRVEAMWDLIDRDGDGMIDEAEMNNACELVIEPVRKALDRVFQEGLQASSVQAPPTPIEPDGDGDSQQPPPRPGFRQRRREAKQKKRLSKMFQRTLKVHFLDEVEMPHRLRCIYAWANKDHQENKVDSVLVDDAGWSGRKRYVELNPKIRLPEFREVQQEHFTHLDRVGEEFIKSFREELWIAQGKRRNRQVLLRDCSIFMAVVCSIDFAIGSL